MKSKDLALGGILIAVAMVLAFIERMFPLQAVVPIPGIKLGLANVVTVFVLCSRNLRFAVAILLCRVLLTASLFGSVTSMLFSLCGGLLAAVVMWAVLRLPKSWVSLLGVSVAGAAAHNIGQIGAAIAVMGTTDVLGYLPALLLLAVPMGVTTGAVATVTVAQLGKLSL